MQTVWCRLTFNLRDTFLQARRIHHPQEQLGVSQLGLMRLSRILCKRRLITAKAFFSQAE